MNKEDMFYLAIPILCLIAAGVFAYIVFSSKNDNKKESFIIDEYGPYYWVDRGFGVPLYDYNWPRLGSGQIGDESNEGLYN